MSYNFALSGGHETTLDIAQIILENGGNAFDAAISAHLAMYLTEPCMASAGAGGFALCYKKGASAEMLDFFTQTPTTKNLESEIDFDSIRVNFGNETEEFHIGMASIATPGSVAGIFAIYERYASMPFKDLVAPVIELARKGVAINTFQSIDIALLEPVFKRDPQMRDVFFKGDKIISEGDHFHLPHLVDFLELLTREGRDGFYKGTLPSIIDQHSRERGGFIRAEDFQNYQAIWRKPLKIDYAGKQVIMANGPSIGSALAAILLRYQEEDNDWLQSTIRLKEQNLAIAEMESCVNTLYGKPIYTLASKHTATKGTSHFNIVDHWGNAVALTCTLGEGSGYFVPGTDMQLNNMMGESFLLPEGFHNWRPDVRLNSMMTPTMVFDNDSQLNMVCGSGGAGRIPYMIAQMIGFKYKNQLSLEEAMAFPRIYLHHGTVHHEWGYKGALTDKYPVKAWKEKSLFFGGVHAICLDEDELSAMGDPRRYGAATVRSVQT